MAQLPPTQTRQDLQLLLGKKEQHVWLMTAWNLHRMQVSIRFAFSKISPHIWVIMVAAMWTDSPGQFGGVGEESASGPAGLLPHYCCYLAEAKKNAPKLK